MRIRWLVLPLALVVVAAAFAQAVLAYDASREDAIAEGVTVAGVDVGGMSADEARAAVARNVASLERPVEVRHGRRSFTLSPDAAGVEIDVDALIETAVRKSREGSLLDRLLRDVGDDPLDLAVPLRVTHSRASVASFVARIKRAVDRPAHDARVVPSITELTTIHSRNGIGVRARALERTLAKRLRTPSAPRVLEAPTEVRKPKVSTRDLPREYPAFITITREEKTLRLFKNLRLAKVYRIAVGQAGFDTPSGLHAIQNKAVNPAWHAPNKPWAGEFAGKVIPPGSPSNPIKARWMGFFNGAGIHGTDAVDSIGTAASHGCIRMTIPDVVDLYEQVGVGTPVYIA